MNNEWKRVKRLYWDETPDGRVGMIELEDGTTERFPNTDTRDEQQRLNREPDREDTRETEDRDRIEATTERD